MRLNQGFVAPDHENHSFDSACGSFFYRVLNERLAGYWEHFLGDGLGRGKHPRAKTGRRNDRLNNSFTIVHSKITFAEMREENFRGKELRREIGPWGLFFCRRLHRFPLHLSDFEYWAGNQHVSGHRLKDSVSDVIVEELMTRNRLI